MSQGDVAGRARAAQVEVAVTQARFFGRGGFFLDGERRRLRRVQDVQARSEDFHFAGGEIGIGLGAADDAAFHGHDEFGAELLGLGVGVGGGVLVEDHLDNAGAVAQVDKDQVAQVAPPRNPTHQDDIATVVADAQRAAVMCALESAE